MVSWCGEKISSENAKRAGQKPDESEASGDESDESEPELTRTISIASSHGDTMPAKLSRKDMNQKSVIEHCTDRIANVAATSGSDGGLRRAESMAVAEGCLVSMTQSPTP